MKEQSLFPDCTILSGGTRELGLATGRQLLSRRVNQRLAIFDTNDPNCVCEQLSREFMECQIVFISADMTRRDNVRNAFDAVRKVFECAVTLVVILNEQECESMVAVNLIGTINVIYEAINTMSTTHGGQGGIISNVSSIDDINSVSRRCTLSYINQQIIELMRSLGTDYLSQKHGISFITFMSTPADPNRKTTPEFDKMVETSHMLMDALASGKHNSSWIAQSGELQEVVLLRNQIKRNDGHPL